MRIDSSFPLFPNNYQGNPREEKPNHEDPYDLDLSIQEVIQDKPNSDLETEQLTKTGNTCQCNVSMSCACSSSCSGCCAKTRTCNGCK